MQVIEKALEKCNGNISELAREIGIERSNLSNMVAGRKPVPPWIASKAAEIAGEDERLAELEAAIATARTDAEREYWEKVKNRTLSGVRAAALLFALTPLLGGVPFGDSKASEGALEGVRVHSVYYVKYKSTQI